MGDTIRLGNVGQVVEHDRRRHFSRIGMISITVGASALIWICQPSSLTRFDTGSIISGVVARLRQVKTDTARTEAVHALQLGISDRGVDHNDGACLPRTYQMT